MAGVPARRIGWACMCGVPLPKGAGRIECAECRRRYTVTAERCEHVE
jgi:UDP-2-acetamido-3-amino-2,3-dideoxy-glucuronate N-acetyltransferase